MMFYRVAVTASLQVHYDQRVRHNAGHIVWVTAAIINLVAIEGLKFVRMSHSTQCS